MKTITCNILEDLNTWKDKNMWLEILEKWQLQLLEQVPIL
jgi:hypothetical protein